MSAKQVETISVVGSVTKSGNVLLTVTAARMDGSPKAISVPVLLSDDAATVAGKIRNALAFDETVSGYFLVSGSSENIVLTARLAAPNDATMNIGYENDTCEGLTDKLTSANTTPGSGIANGYCTLDEFKDYVTVRGGGISDDANDDAVMEVLIESASRKIDEITGRRFYKAAETRYFWPDDSESLYTGDLVSIDELHVDYYGTREYTELAADDFEYFPENASQTGKPYSAIYISPNSAAYFPQDRRAVKIVGVFGWPSVPAQIKNDCMAIAHNLWMSRSGQASGGKVTITSGGIVIRPEDIPPHAMTDLQIYRIVT